MLFPFILFTLIILFAGLLSLSFRKPGRVQKVAPAFIIAVASLFALVYLLRIFQWIDFEYIETFMNWSLPFASLQAGIDPLSAFFLIPLLILSFSSALYGPRYFHKEPAGRFHWFFFSLLIAGMVMVLLSRNAVLFIISWEVMSLSSFFLVITDKKKPESLGAGWIYFVTAHIGTGFLLVLFFLLSSSAGSFDFSAWRSVSLTSGQADLIFIIALIAFGLKAGFIPFHVWLPLAHPAAPSHVSALMSGIMIKMGIYGLLRILLFIMPFHAWWGGLLIVLGGLSGILGVLFAIGQHDIKRLLAYHSVENIGIILLGIGIGIVGAACGSPIIALFGFAGGLLHVLNHALFKGLLFLGAGAVIRQTGTGEIDRLGGLIKFMPRTALLFLIGSIAICGLPFFNGFISELMIYTAGITGAVETSSSTLPLAGLAGVFSLALIGGLAAACFTKVFGIIFLGEPRTKAARISADVPYSMLTAMGFLAALCILIGLGSVFVLPFLLKPALLFARLSAPAVKDLSSLTGTVNIILISFVTAIVVIAGLIKIFHWKKCPAGKTVTWDCGYSRPAPTMQYTASSFAAPILKYFNLPLAGRKKLSSDQKLFPSSSWSFHSGVEDWFLTRIYAPGTKRFDRLFSSLRWFQSGKTEQYILYIAITVFCLILWKLFL